MSGKFQIKGNLASLLKFPILTSVHLARRGCKLHRGGGLRVENTTRIGSVVVVVGLSSTSTQVHLAPWGEGESQEGGTGGDMGDRPPLALVLGVQTPLRPKVLENFHLNV